MTGLPCARGSPSLVCGTPCCSLPCPLLPRRRYGAQRGACCRPLLTRVFAALPAWQILGNTEAFEPITSNVYSRRTLSGDFVVVNKYMVKDLIKRGLWASLKNEIVADRGSVQNIASVPADIKALYKTAWELKMKVRRARGVVACPCCTSSPNPHCP
jgi:hypothetical protein